MEIEKEKKIMITEYQYNKVKSELCSLQQVRNMNFYYDDLERSMIFSGRTIRVRAKKEKMYLQMKRHVDKRKGMTVSEEFCKEIQVLPYHITSEELLDLTDCTYPDVFLLGFLVTDRSIFTYNSKIQFMIDKNYYLNHIDYELEVEYTCEDNEMDSVFQRLSEYGIEFENGENISKSYRFAKRYYNI